MHLKIDKAGRIIVPKRLRDRFGFQPDADLRATEHPDGVLITRAQQSAPLVKIDGLWVHQGAAAPGANWDRVLDDAREERLQTVLNV